MNIMEIFKNEHIVFIAARLLWAAVIITASQIIILAGWRVIKKGFTGGKTHTDSPGFRRLDTLEAVFLSIFKYAVILVAMFLFLRKVFMVDVVTLVTVAGVGGVAIGFGCQALVKDVVTGLFILMEGQFLVGDRITAKDKTGVVTEIGLRATKITDDSGDVHFFPNSELLVVTNHSVKERL